jgi:hypothetical protein
MFITPFAREVRLAQTKPTRAPVLGLVLFTPPLRGSQHFQGRSGPRESVVDWCFSPRSAPQLEAVRHAGRWEVRLTPLAERAAFP